MVLPSSQKKSAVSSQAISPGKVKPLPTGQQATFKAPSIAAFSIKAKLSGTLKEVASSLRSVSFLEVAQEKDAVNALYVESRDINKQPYVFSILKANDEQLEVVYSIPQNIAPWRRRLDMIRYFINVITLLEPHYDIDTKIILQLMESSVKDVVDSVSMDYSKLYTEFDTVKKEFDDAKKKAKRLSDENSVMSTENYALKNRNDELVLRLNQLENIPEDAIRAKVQEWILEHNGEINITEFAKLNNINEVKVEEALNRLIMEGYIEAVG
ncbi:MAG: hypothetical protein WCT31_02815 [Candidatus Micrarchaeia archaeon]